MKQQSLNMYTLVILPIRDFIIRLGRILFKLPLKDACKIAIFGSKASGKTTLWNQLRHKCEDCNCPPTLGIDDINSFDIEFDGKIKTIAKSKDYGGSDDFVKDYEQVISAGTFIYYLIDLTKLDDFEKETNARLAKIMMIIKDKKISDSVGMTLVATHYKEYKDSHPGKNKQDARNELISVLGLSNKKFKYFADNIMVAELTDKNDIQQFFKQIVEHK